MMKQGVKLELTFPFPSFGSVGLLLGGQEPTLLSSLLIKSSSSCLPSPLNSDDCNGLPKDFVDGDPSPVSGAAEAGGDRTAPLCSNG